MRSPDMHRARFPSRRSSRHRPSRCPSTISFMAAPSDYLYVSPRLDGVAVFSTDALDGTTERHRVCLEPGHPTPTVDPLASLNGGNRIRGVVIGLSSGLPDRRRLELAADALARGLRVWLHWPDEQA